MSFERICRLQQLKDEGIDGVTPCEKDCNLAAMLGYFNIPKESVQCDASTRLLDSLIRQKEIVKVASDNIQTSVDQYKEEIS